MRDEVRELFFLHCLDEVIEVSHVVEVARVSELRVVDMKLLSALLILGCSDFQIVPH
jgi:hypothetical protein